MRTVNAERADETYHGRNGEVARTHLVRQELDLATSVAKDHGLGNRQRLIQIAERLEFVALEVADVDRLMAFNEH